MSQEEGFMQQWGRGLSALLTDRMDLSLNENLSSYQQFARSEEVSKNQSLNIIISLLMIVSSPL